MSDVSDWTGVSAGATQLLASGQSVAIGGGTNFTASILITNVPQTTRSLLLLLNWDAGNTGPTSVSQVLAQGDTTKIRWSSTESTLNDTGGTSLGAGTSLSPVYFPFYGQVDTSGYINVKCGAAGTWNYWLLALPDADLLGSAAVPLTVMNPPYPLLSQDAGAGVGVAPVYGLAAAGLSFPVELFDGAGNQQGTQAAPLVVERFAPVTGLATQTAAPGGNVTILTVTAGQTWYLRTAILTGISSDAYPGHDGQLLLNGTPIGRIRLAGSVAQHQEVPLPDGGLAMTSGGVLSVYFPGANGEVTADVGYSTTF